MEKYFREWEAHALYKLKEDVLKTISYIHENKSRDSGKALSSQQLDDAKDAMCILHMMSQMEDEEHEMHDAHHAAHTHATTAAKPAA